MPVHRSPPTRDFFYMDRIQRFCFLWKNSHQRKPLNLLILRSGKTSIFSFQNIFYKKPACNMQVLHNLQEQLLGFHKSFKSSFLKSNERVNLLDSGWNKLFQSQYMKQILYHCKYCYNELLKYISLLQQKTINFRAPIFI